MNEFTAKKLGEVLAFAEIGKETMERGLPAFVEIYGEEKVSELIKSQGSHSEEIRNLANKNGVSEIVLKKLESTGEKLRKMRDLYVGDQWDNPTELLEWSGFFEGAALVHWSLVRGVAEGIASGELMSLAATGMTFHQDMLNETNKNLLEVGKKKSVLN